MSNELNVPDEVKEQINMKLVENGTMESIEQEIKAAMKTAAREIRNNKTESELEYAPLKNMSEGETDAFKAVVKFLEEKGLKFSLATLLEEAGLQKPDTGSILDVCEYLTAVKKNTSSNNSDKEGDDSDSDIVVVPAKQE
ncbi:hypothetical protein TVAG_281970 [Trichomonas vaginalis G3]|uniref:Uncharacterized protein n=1 Tax=Trichomonas vaginalis (strain ATCC PRA-98 / G3) TaxID=412133 RepID=A2E9R2_TRIV3|nr:hypothetical protein TVAGG3_0043320 [Trichomonas vaginalis G3]EAY10597.1 hypothetical protein TVAG_281970 [Trichomonas vaginalis G3]KAI5540849.1 hypothetical protein TVAGG3_0043320 [Trichomonas vaginalis G3]|eukprot:XP_001322820.1 hypothetical protein [Trichomonas vaginalis G3]